MNQYRYTLTIDVLADNEQDAFKIFLKDILNGDGTLQLQEFHETDNSKSIHRIDGTPIPACPWTDV